ncbi:hypothetical protein CTAYLR_004528 [Chrysophaeum taylorii]|uniref:non-specific serine/threonine protein kinase n=1 Tax=Chrysophaeum taylorii TaxID=2483200 RepID=A0AAD7UPH3_9STRA|nr:hypothetical protein CTAYLR_004528 [Chrysophaeum taylorii]
MDRNKGWRALLTLMVVGGEELPAGFQHEPSGSAVSAGHFHTCALRRTPKATFGGIAHCWGFDGLGQVSMAPSRIFVQLSSGHFHTCGVTMDQKVYCWGEERATELCPSGLFQQVSAGQFHTCGLAKDGQVRCWGDDQLVGCATPPKGTKFVQVATGNDWTCALRRNGLVVCWGNNKRGQATPPNETRFVQIAASTSGYHTCGITYGANDLVCWGESRKGEAPVFRPGPFAQVAVGFRTTCVVPRDGATVDCFGLSGHLLAPLPIGRTWDQITLGRDHICALDADGALHCRGQPTIDAARVPPGFLVA